MILNENVPCRASRAWWLPFTSLALGLFAVPTVAQSRPQDPKPVEIRVNGKDVEDLSAAERKALLKKLLAAEESADTPKAAGKKGAKAGAKPQTLVITEAHEHEGHDHEAHEQEAHEVHRAHGHQVPGGMPSTKEIHAQIKAGLAEARAEIEGDEDLRELGITDEVCQLIDDLADGKGLGNLDALVKKAMQGAGKLAVKEIAADEDLKKLGMTEGITKLVQGFLGDERMQEMVCDLAQSAAKNALKEAKVELRNDPDLKKLGITVDVEGLLDGMFTGHGDFGTHLQQIIEKAMQHAKHEGLIEIGGEPMEVDVVEVPAPKKAGKKGRKAKSDR